VLLPKPVNNSAAVNYIERMSPPSSAGSSPIKCKNKALTYDVINQKKEVVSEIGQAAANIKVKNTKKKKPKFVEKAFTVGSNIGNNNKLSPPSSAGSTPDNNNNKK
jgi:hypothetical protein